MVHHDLQLVLDNIRMMAAADDLAAVIVHLNDTYVIEESRRGLPGMARVATVVDRIRGEVFRATGKQRTLVLHSGDFMMPSRLGRETKGASMTKMLGQFVDVVTLGNHEFDLGPKALGERMRDLAARRVQVVCTNVTFPPENFPGIFTERIIYWPSESAPLFAIVGVMGSNVAPEGKEWAAARFHPPGEVIRESISAGLRGARRLIVLSHDDREEDLKMLTFLDGELTARPGFGYLLGGHDHEIDWSQRYVGPSMGRTVFSKCRSNAKSLRVFLVRCDPTLRRWRASSRTSHLASTWDQKRWRFARRSMAMTPIQFEKYCRKQGSGATSEFDSALMPS